MAAVPAAYQAAIARYGPLADAEAKKYHLTGSQLIAKILSGESSFNMGAVSGAGARGAGQFIAGTRQDYISKYGIDPWASIDQAVHATALFMKEGGGLAAYNPGGGQGYINYILGQNVSGVPAGGSAAAAATPGGGGGGLFDSVRGGAVKALLWVTFVFAGAWIAFRGAAKLAGVQPSGVNVKATPA